MTPAEPAVGVVVATRDRRDDLLGTLPRLLSLPGPPPVVVVDNGSEDGTPDAVARAFPAVEVVELGGNAGAAARTAGARKLSTPYVAFADDDSWWAPDALTRATALFARSPRLAGVAARVLVGEGEELDPVCEAMAGSPLGREDGLPGPRVLGFVACGAILRREPFLAVGGFEGRLGIGGEEELLALDLAAAGWSIAYVPEVVAHHHPSPVRDASVRRRVQVRNALWTSWLRRRPDSVARATLAALRGAGRDLAAARGVAAAARGLPWVLRERRAVPRDVELMARDVESAG